MLLGSTWPMIWTSRWANRSFDTNPFIRLTSGNTWRCCPSASRATGRPQAVTNWGIRNGTLDLILSPAEFLKPSPPGKEQGCLPISLGPWPNSEAGTDELERYQHFPPFMDPVAQSAEPRFPRNVSRWKRPARRIAFQAKRAETQQRVPLARLVRRQQGRFAKSTNSRREPLSYSPVRDHESIRFGPRAVPARSGRARTRARVIFPGCCRGPHAATGDRSRSATSLRPAHGQRLVHGELPFASRMHWDREPDKRWERGSVSRSTQGFSRRMDFPESDRVGEAAAGRQTRAPGLQVRGEPRRFFSAHWVHEPDLNKPLNDQ